MGRLVEEPVEHLAEGHVEREELPQHRHDGVLEDLHPDSGDNAAHDDTKDDSLGVGPGHIGAGVGAAVGAPGPDSNEPVQRQCRADCDHLGDAEEDHGVCEEGVLTAASAFNGRQGYEGYGGAGEVGEEGGAGRDHGGMEEDDEGA